MRIRSTWFAAAAVGAIAATVAFSGRLAGAEDEGKAPPGGMQFQKKIDHPLAKALLGTWDATHKSEHFPESKGTVKFALGVADTALIEDYDISMGPMGSFVGHSVWKVSDDGKTLHAWWIDIASPKMQHFEGALTDKGFDVKSEDGTRLTLAQAGTGFEFKLFMAGSDKPFFTDTYVKK